MYATIPGKAKLSKAISRDQARPTLCEADLRETADGWELVGTDSFKLARVPLTVHKDNGEPLTPGPISAQALKAIEQSGGFRANGVIEPVSVMGHSRGQSFARPERTGDFPNVDQVEPPAPANAVEFAFNAKLLWELAQALGGNGHVRLTVDADNPLRAIRVRPCDGESRGLLMPVRI